MNTLSRCLRVLFLVGEIVLGGMAVFIYFLLPMRTISGFLHLTDESVNKYWLFGVYASILGMLVCDVLRRVYTSVPNPLNSQPMDPPQRNKIPKWFTVFQIVATFAILARAAMGLDAPFDTDEYATIESIITGVNPNVNIFNNAVHFLSSNIAVLSMKAFGISNLACKLPSMFFATLLLALVAFFCRLFFSPLVGVLIYLHLFANQMILWYMHSTRGYILMILVTSYLFYVVKGIASQKRFPIKFEYYLVPSLALLTPFIHGFASVFIIVLIVSLAVWIAFMNEPASPSAARYRTAGLHILTPLLLLSPIIVAHIAAVMGILGPHSAHVTEKYYNIKIANLAKESGIVPALQGVLGGTHVQQLKVLLVIFCFFLWRNRKRLDYIGIFLLSYFAIVGGQHLTLNNYLIGRHLLNLPILIVAWFSVHALSYGTTRLKTIIIFSGLAILFFVIPFADGDINNFQLDRKPYHAFIKQVRHTLPKPIPFECLHFSSADVYPGISEARVADYFYFQGQRVRSSRDNYSATCAQRYQIHFTTSWDLDAPKATLADLPKGRTYEPLYEDSDGRFLAKIVSIDPPTLGSNLSRP